MLEIPELSDKDKVRFWDKVDVRGKDECWEWKAGKLNSGYGKFWLHGKKYLAHRIAWFLVNGPIPDGKLVLHDCDNPSCVNENQLFLGIQKDNIQDAVKKNRMATGDRHGARIHPEKLARGDKHGSRTHPESRPRGESHGVSKLTERQVLIIRKRYSKGEKQCKIAQDLMVSQAQISNIINGRFWAHV